MTEEGIEGGRRGFLAVLGAGAAAGAGATAWVGTLAGGNPLESGGPERHAVGERVPLDDGSVALKDLDLRIEVVSGDSPGVSGADLRVRRNPGGQWLVAAVDDTTVLDEGAERERFSLEFGGRNERPLPEEPRVRLISPMSWWQAQEWDLAVPFPAVDLEAADVVWTGPERTVRWAVPDALLEQATSLPAFEVRDFVVPASVARGERFGVSVTLANRGDRPGIANAIALARTPDGELASDGIGAISTELGWDESQTLERAIPVDYDAVDDAIEIELRTGVGTLSQRVTVDS